MVIAGDGASLSAFLVACRRQAALVGTSADEGVRSRKQEAGGRRPAMVRRASSPPDASCVHTFARLNCALPASDRLRWSDKIAAITAITACTLGPRPIACRLSPLSGWSARARPPGAKHWPACPLPASRSSVVLTSYLAPFSSIRPKLSFSSHSPPLLPSRFVVVAPLNPLPTVTIEVEVEAEEADEPFGCETDPVCASADSSEHPLFVWPSAPFRRNSFAAQLSSAQPVSASCPFKASDRQQ